MEGILCVCGALISGRRIHGGKARAQLMKYPKDMEHTGKTRLIILRRLILVRILVILAILILMQDGRIRFDYWIGRIYRIYQIHKIDGIYQIDRIDTIYPIDRRERADRIQRIERRGWTDKEDR